MPTTSVARVAQIAPVAERRPLPRVLYVIAMDGSQKFGSLDEQIFLLAQAFRAEGSLLLPLFLDPAAPGQGGIAMYQAAELPTANLDLWGFRPWKLLRLNALIGRHQIQVVNWNFYNPLNGYVMALSALRPRLRHCFTDHNSRLLPIPPAATGITRLVKRFLLKRFCKVWSVSNYVQDCLAAQKSWSNLECCLHFINTERFKPDAAVRQAVRREHGCEGRFVVLTVANLIPEKGIDVAIKAMALAPANAILWVVGSGPEKANLESLAAELGVSQRLTFFGQQNLVQPFMQAADCVVCPSRWAEAAGLVNLEALSTGLPVVASRIGGIPEYVDDGRTGMLFPPNDHQALALALGRLHDCPAECRRLGEAARKTAVEQFSANSKTSEYLDLYRDCL